ncbi:uncharacterized protein LOC136089836 [Hydra vulgaris]|uniref:Uncharacterized protein LOC136089836 n=1 Tax=Hydra vulgaris TaxID=6087 RepID=A0ABM4DC66_HYDVU
MFVVSCCRTRLLYLDLVPDYTAEACICVLRRFIGRYGAPYQVISDNGSNFTAEETLKFASMQRIRWSFNIPAAPWWGGIYERLIRITKRNLKKTLGTSRLKCEEMLTILAEIEFITNKCPITFTYD